MTKYIVMFTSFATDDNPNFAHEFAVAYYGKNQKLLGYVGPHAERVCCKKSLYKWLIEEYGYNRECDARKSWVFKNPENSAYWISNTNIIKVEI